MSSSNNNRNSLSLLYEKSLKKVSGVYIQTKQNSIKLLSTLNINIANKFNEIEQKSNINNNLENCNKENKCVDSRTTFLNPPTPYQIDNFISDVPTPHYNNLMNQKGYYNDDDDIMSSIHSPMSAPSSAHLNSPSYKNYAYGQFPLYSPFARTRKSPYGVNEKDFSDQESSDDQDDYFSRKISNYSSQSSSSSVSTSFGISEFALTPLTNDDGCEVIEEEINHIGKERSKEKIFKRRKSTMKSLNSQKSDRSIKSNKSISKLSLKLSKNKSSSSSTATDTVGTINFEEFISSLDISEDVEGRLQWLFRFFDKDDDGFITRGEMLEIMNTLYS